MVGRRLAAAAALAAGSLVWAAGPAVAAPPTGTVATPGDAQSLVTSSAHVSGDVRPSSPNGSVIGNVRLELTSLEAHPIPPDSSSLLVPAQDPNRVPFDWTPTLPWNGHYHLDVVATERDGPLGPGETGRAAVRDFTVDAPPSAPTGVVAGTDQAKGDVRISWRANAEPDLVGYTVERAADPGSAWSTIATTPDTSATDPGVKATGGTFRYRVVATRHTSDPAKGIVSAPSQAVTVTVAAPPPPPATSDAGPTNGATAGTGSPSATGSPTTSGSTGPAIARNGTVDLKDFAALLDRARAGSTKVRPVAAPPDPGFKASLPFVRPDEPKEDGPGEVPAVVPSGVPPSVVRATSDRRPSAVFVAASLLVTVLLMHMVLVRSALRRADGLVVLAPTAGAGPPQLQPLEPEAVAAQPPAPRPRRRRAAAAAHVPRRAGGG